MTFRTTARMAGLAAVALFVAVVPAGAAHAAPPTVNVRDYGAVGKGSTLDDDAIDGPPTSG